MTSPAFDNSWTRASMKLSVYEWVRNCLGLMPLRVNCWKHCWMSDAAWTEWKNYSPLPFSSGEWPRENTSPFARKLTTLGTRLRFVSAAMQSETSIQAQRNVRRLRISKSLTCDDLNVVLTSTLGSAKTPWSRFDCVFGASVTSARTSWLSCGRGNGKQALIDEWMRSDGDLHS